MKLNQAAVVLLALLFAAAHAEARIVEKTKMEDAISSADESTLLIFDIDNTVLEPKQMFGSDAWYHYLFDKHLKAGMSKAEVAEMMNAAYIQMHEASAVRPVEANTPSLIRAAQERGIKTIALTARPLVLAERTVEQLESIRVDFRRNRAWGKDLKEIDGKGKYFGGIIFGGIGNEKGPILTRFLKRTGLAPKRILFVDDKPSNIESVDRALTAEGIDCECIRYGAADGQAKSFDPHIAAIQMEYHGNILDDASARAIAKARKKS